MTYVAPVRIRKSSGPDRAFRPVKKVVRHSHVIGIDALRLMAVGLVMSYHFAFWNWVPGQPLEMILGPQAPTWGGALHFGWVGVEIFFVISGFVIAYSSADARPAAFLQNRVLRLAPANWIGATVVLFCLAGAGLGSVASYGPRYLETLVFWPLNAIDGVWWTLGIEIAFYTLVYCLLAQGWRMRLEATMIRWSIVTLMFWVAALGLPVFLQGSTDPRLTLLLSLILRAEGNRELQLLLVQHAAFFAAGVIAFNAARHGLTRARLYALSLVIPACCLEIVGQNGIIARSAHLALSPVPALLTWLFAMALLVACLRYNQAMFSRGRGTGVLRFVVVATYPLYLVHNAVGVLIVVWLFPFIGVSALPAAVVGATSVALLVALIPEPGIRSLILRVWPRIDGRVDTVAHATVSVLNPDEGQVAAQWPSTGLAAEPLSLKANRINGA